MKQNSGKRYLSDIIKIIGNDLKIKELSIGSYYDLYSFVSPLFLLIASDKTE